MKYTVFLKNNEGIAEITADRFELIKKDGVWFYAFETGKGISAVKSSINLESADAVFAYDAVLWIKKVTQ